MRRRVVAAVESGRSQVEVATVFDVSLLSVPRRVSTFRTKGNRGLQAGKRGRRPDEQKALGPRQQDRIRRAVIGKFPDQVALSGLVWTRGQVADLVKLWFGTSLSRVTIGRYLRSWGLSPRKPVRKAHEQNPQAVTRWLEQGYPAITARATREKAVILWLDQTGLRSDAAVGTTWAPVARTPLVPKTGKRFGANAMIAISNKGELYFTVFEGTFTTKVMTTFCDRLTRHLDRKIHLILDGHPVHRSRAVKDWMTERVDLADEARTHLRRLQNQPKAVQALFGKEEVRYAAH